MKPHLPKQSIFIWTYHDKYWLLCAMKEKENIQKEHHLQRGYRYFSLSNMTRGTLNKYGKVKKVVVRILGPKGEMLWTKKSSFWCWISIISYDSILIKVKMSPWYDTKSGFDMIFCRMSRLEGFTRLRFCKSFCNFKVVLGDPWEFRTKQRHQSQILKVQHMTMCLSKNDKKKLKICPKKYYC